MYYKRIQKNPIYSNRKTTTIIFEAIILFDKPNHDINSKKNVKEYRMDGFSLNTKQHCILTNDEL